MPNKITFDQQGREQIHSAIEKFMGISDETLRTQIIDTIENSGVIRRFGYGSLINDPEMEISRKYGAHIDGWKKGYVCKDNTYRGTPEKPGLTLGLDESDNPNASIAGAILENDLTQENALATTLKWIEAYGNREYPSGMPIYSFKVLDVAAEDGSSVAAVVCVADDKGPLYVGNQLTLDEKAAVIATAIAAEDRNPNTIAGKDPKAGFLTNLQYLYNDINNGVKAGNDIDPEFLELLEKAKSFRQAMPAAQRENLEGYEVTEKLDASVYAVPTTIPEAYNVDASQYLLDAREKLGQAFFEPTNG